MTDMRSDRTARWGIFDLFVALAISTMSASLALLPHPMSFPFRVLAGGFSVLLIPGYVTLVAVKPGIVTRDEFDWMEIAVLSIIGSIVIVPILGLILNFASLGIFPSTIVLTVYGYTVLTALVAGFRRLIGGDGISELPPRGSIREHISGHSSTNLDRLLNLLVLGIFLAGTVLVFTPIPGDGPPVYTEFGVLSANDSGRLQLDDYFSTIEANGTVYLLIANKEYDHQRYTIVSQVQRAELQTRSVAVVERRELNRVTVEVAHNESALIPYEFRVSESRTGCRVAFLLYKGELPPEPTSSNAYRDLHLWHTPDPPVRQSACTLRSIHLEVNRSGVRSQKEWRGAN